MSALDLWQPSDYVALVKHAANLRVRPADLLAVYASESGLNPAVGKGQKDANGVLTGARGLGELVKAIATDMSPGAVFRLSEAEWDGIASLSPAQQFPIFERGFAATEKGLGRPYSSATELYSANFAPSVMVNNKGISPTTKIYTRNASSPWYSQNSLAWAQNPIDNYDAASQGSPFGRALSAAGINPYTNPQAAVALGDKLVANQDLKGWISGGDLDAFLQRPSIKALVTDAMARGKVAFASAPVAQPAAYVPVSAGAKRIRIQAIGDSITNGYNTPGGYRAPLGDRLRARGVLFDAVGTLSTNPKPGSPDVLHDGHGGWTTKQMADELQKWLYATMPDAVLLMAGTNDVIAHYPTAEILARIGSMVDQIQKGARVVLATIPSPFGLDVEPLNAGIRAIAASKGTGLADVGAVIGPADLFDKVHPNAAGYAKIAAVFDAMIPAGAGTSPASLALPFDIENPFDAPPRYGFTYPAAGGTTPKLGEAKPGKALPKLDAAGPSGIVKLVPVVLFGAVVYLLSRQGTAS
jgi:lysophospholipase L1-like esterase